MTLPGIRLTFLILFLGAIGLILTGFYFEFVLKLNPCPLCITQRVFIIAGGLVGLIAYIHNPALLGRRIYAGLGVILAVAGGRVSAQQVWLQSLPADQQPACGPDLSYLLSNFPFKEALEILFRGDGNCAIIDWSFLGLSIAGWTLVAFTGIAVINLWQGLRRQTAANGWVN